MAGAKRAVTALLIGAAILLAAGCGGGGSSTSGSPAAGTTTTADTTASTTTSAEETTPLPKADYVRKMKTIGRSLSTSLNTLGSATTAAAAAKALQAVQTDLRDAAERIESLAPPEAVKSLHAQLVKAVRDFADELDPVINKLKAGKMTALSSVPTLKGLREIQTASTAIANKGFKIGG
jgi:hypothetical protein